MRLNTIDIELTDADVDRIASRVAEILQPDLKRIEDAPRTDGKMLTVKQVCDRLNIARSTLWYMRKRGEIQPVRVGQSLRFRPEDVERIRHS